MKIGQQAFLAFITGSISSSMGYSWETWQFWALIATMIAYGYVSALPERQKAA